MRRAAMLVLLALLAVAIAFAQNPASANSTAPASNQQNGGTNSTVTSSGQDVQNGQNTNSQSPSGQIPTNPQMHPPDSTTGQNNPLPNGQNNNQFPGQNANQNAGQNTSPSGAGNQGMNNESTTPNVASPSAASSSATSSRATSNQENSNPNGGFGQRAVVPSNGSIQGEVAAGTQIHATLDTPLSTKTSKPGDRFTATIAQPVRGTNGNQIIPAGARVEGEVSEAEEGKTVAVLRGRGKLNLRFRDVVLPNGQSFPIAATLVSVHSTNGKDSKNADQEGQMESGTRGRDVAKDVGIGAGIGTVAGLLFGGPLKGLAIGALAGGGYVLATKGKEVNLPAETGMVLNIDQPLSIGATSSRLQR